MTFYPGIRYIAYKKCVVVFWAIHTMRCERCKSVESMDSIWRVTFAWSTAKLLQIYSNKWAVPLRFDATHTFVAYLLLCYNFNFNMIFSAYDSIMQSAWRKCLSVSTQSPIVHMPIGYDSSFHHAQPNFHRVGFFLLAAAEYLCSCIEYLCERRGFFHLLANQPKNRYSYLSIRIKKNLYSLNSHWRCKKVSKKNSSRALAFTHYFTSGRGKSSVLASSAHRLIYYWIFNFRQQTTNKKVASIDRVSSISGLNADNIWRDTERYLHKSIEPTALNATTNSRTQSVGFSFSIRGQHACGIRSRFCVDTYYARIPARYV